MAKLVIRHDLHLMTKEELNQYLRDVSSFVGIDPDLNAFDAIWMPNESGNGQSLVVYARRGTAEILRNMLGIEVDSLTHEIVNGSIVYTAKGHNTFSGVQNVPPGRHEVAIGSKYIKGLEGKTLDDAIMTASTRALRRLTMQFTTLGILDESEVNAAKAEAPPANPAATATLAPNPTPPVFTQPSVPVNNAPGKPVEPTPAPAPPVEPPKPLLEPFTGQQSHIDEAMTQVKAKQEAADEPEAVTTARPKRARKPKNTITLDVEPETVSTPKAVSAPVETPAPIEKPASAPAPPISVPVVGPDPIQSVAGMPTKEQMDSYRTKVKVYTDQLPASAELGSVQKMRAFITHMSGAAPQNMTVVQWEKQIKFFQDFVGKNGIKGLVKYINDSLGVK